MHDDQSDFDTRKHQSLSEYYNWRSLPNFLLNNLPEISKSLSGLRSVGHSPEGPDGITLVFFIGCISGSKFDHEGPLVPVALGRQASVRLESLDV